MIATTPALEESADHAQASRGGGTKTRGRARQSTDSQEAASASPTDSRAVLSRGASLSANGGPAQTHSGVLPYTDSLASTGAGVPDLPPVAHVPTDSRVSTSGGGAVWALLALHAANLDDIERARIAAQNRARALRLDFGLEGSPQELAALALAESLAAAEKAVERQVKLALRATTLGAWVKDTTGVGERQAARLLGVIGDPAWHPVHERPRKLRELWRFCGLDVVPAVLAVADSQQNFGGGGSDGEDGSLPEIQPDACDAAADGLSSLRSADDPPSFNPPDAITRAAVGSSASAEPGGPASLIISQAEEETAVGPPGSAPRKRRGQRLAWHPEARMRAWNIAQSVIKCGGPFREVYDAGRVRYANAVHLLPCSWCSPVGKPPAPPGSPLTPRHQHARATRLVMKAVVKAMWQESRRQHGWAEEDPWA